MPGTKGNRNAQRHGVYGYLTIGSLPKGASYVRRLVGQFRISLENAVQEHFGEINLYRAALIQSACRHEARAQLLTRWLRVTNGELKLNDKLSVLREIGSASDSRDKCLEKLELNKDRRETIFDAIYQPVQLGAGDVSDRDNSTVSKAVEEQGTESFGIQEVSGEFGKDNVIEDRGGNHSDTKSEGDVE